MFEVPRKAILEFLFSQGVKERTYQSHGTLLYAIQEKLGDGIYDHVEYIKSLAPYTTPWDVGIKLDKVMNELERCHPGWTIEDDIYKSLAA